jgi:dimethylargininase
LLFVKPLLSFSVHPRLPRIIAATMPTAITRAVSPALALCELTHLAREPIDVARAAAQHAVYERRLESLGLRVVSLPAELHLPDCVFVEDTAVVVDELAVITRPGAASRRPETAAVGRALERLRPLASIAAPGALDGGDVLRLGRRLLVGLSGRTNRDGLDQLAALLHPHGYTIEGIPITGCLHLKSAVTQVAADAVLLNPAWVDRVAFSGWRAIEVDPGEPYAANALMLGETVIYPNAFPRTADRLAAAGARLSTLDLSELAKAEGAVTCCSIIVGD